jgi:FecR protein
MRKLWKSSLFGLLFLALASAASAQTTGRDSRVISARAGAVNFVSGVVERNSEGEAAWRALSDKDELGGGDVVRTGAGGRVEVLLNPGSYLRAGGGAQFELADASLDDLRLKLVRGSVVVEATGYGDEELSILFETPQASVRIVRGGIYRFNVLPSGVTEVGVQKGRVRVGAGEQLVKGGHLVRFGGAAAPEVAKAKFKKEERDELDLWSRERGKELAKLNEKVSAQHVSTAFSSFNDPYSPRLHGVWYYNARGGYYTFLPFYASWNSPYGHSYWNRLYSPWGYYNSRPRRGRHHGAHPGTGNRPHRPGAGGGGNSTGGRANSPGGGGGAAAPAPRPVRTQPSVRPQLPRELRTPRARDQQ